MHILQTVSSIEAEAAGPSYSVPQLCGALAALGNEVDLFSLGVPGRLVREGFSDRRFRRDFAGNVVLRRLGLSREMDRALQASNAKVLHTHGLWMMPNVYPAGVARRQGRPFLLSPRGMLGREALQFSRVQKRIFWAALQKRAVGQVGCFHATAEQEYEDVRAAGLGQPVAIIPNGIDLPEVRMPVGRADNGRPYVVSLGRIHPKKALDRLIRAWALVAADFPQWDLRIAGPSELHHADELRALVSALKLPSVEISGPVFGSDKIDLLATAELFALPTLHENFGMTVAESLAVCTPVISSKGAPWSGLEANGCGWWVDHGEAHLAAALRSGMSLSPEERRNMGERGRLWMARDFAWEGIARQMLDVYRWLADGAAPPACVRFG